MKDPEQSIDRVLRGLVDTEPTPELQENVLRHLQRRIEQRSGGKTSGFTNFDLLHGKGAQRRRISFALTSAAVMALLLAVFVSSHQWGLQSAPRAGVASERQAERVRTTTPHTTTPPRRAEQQTSAAVTFPEKVRAGQLDLQRASIHSTGRTPRKAVPEGRSLAEEEAEAPSLVAPPLPLTNSERLLLRLEQGGRLEEYALLTGQLSAQHDAEDREEFRDFFKQSDPQHAD